MFARHEEAVLLLLIANHAEVAARLGVHTVVPDLVQTYIRALALVLSISSPLPFFSRLAMYMTLFPILKIVLWSRKYSADGEPSLLSLIHDLRHTRLPVCRGEIL